MQIAFILCLTVTTVVCQNNRDWHVGADRVQPSGVRVHGHANIPLHRGFDSRLDANVHGSRVFGGPFNRHQQVGGGLNYRQNGLQAGVDATYTRGAGTSYSATVGGNRRLGPGQLSIDGGIAKHPGAKPQGQIGATYSIPF